MPFGSQTYLSVLFIQFSRVTELAQGPNRGNLTLDLLISSETSLLLSCHLKPITVYISQMSQVCTVCQGAISLANISVDCVVQLKDIRYKDIKKTLVTLVQHLKFSKHETLQII